MKYFKAELWQGCNSENKEEVEMSKERWDENNKEYEKVFKKGKERLPKEFLKIKASKIE